MKIERVASEIKKELAMLINYEVRDPRINGAMISIINAEVTGDLKYCKVYVSIMNAENAKETLDALNKSASYLRTELFHRLKVRAVPELTFVIDNSFEYGMKIEKILKEINKNNP